MHVKSNDDGWGVLIGYIRKLTPAQAKRCTALCLRIAYAQLQVGMLVNSCLQACSTLNSSCIVTAAFTYLIAHTYPMFPLPSWSSPPNGRL